MSSGCNAPTSTTSPSESSGQRETTKACPRCGNTYLILLRSLNQKHCSDCNLAIPWYLDPGQRPLT